MDCPWDNGPNCAALHSIPNAVHVSASQDPAPIHSAEHIKFIAAFFNKEEDAERLFLSEVKAMQAKQTQMAARADSDMQTVAWIEKSWDGKYSLSTAPYKKIMTEQAGSKVVDAAAVKTTLGTKMSDPYQVANSADVGDFMQALADNGVTALIDETYASDITQYDFARFLTDFGLTSTSALPFIQNQMVMRVDSGYSGTSNIDWYESRLVFPSKAVAGLQRVLDSDTSKAKAYFRNIAKGEQADAISKDSCTASPAMCSTSSLPAVLPLINTLGIPTLEQRIANGEFAGQALAGSALFPVDYLAPYRSLSAAALTAIDGPIAAAELIEIHYGQTFKVLTETYAQEQYVLTQCGAATPSEADINAVKALPTGFTRKYFTIPLQQVMAESTVQLGFLHELGLHDRVAYVSQYAVGACWQKIHDCNAAGVVTDTSSVDMQATRQNMDAAFMDCPWDNGPNCAALHSIPNAVHFSASQDPAPIHSAEHIKFIAAFFNKEEDAERLFSSEVTAMQAKQTQLAARADSDMQTVAWIEKSWDGKYSLSTAPYKKVMTEQAGSKVVDAAAVKTTLGTKMS